MLVGNGIRRLSRHSQDRVVGDRRNKNSKLAAIPAPASPQASADDRRGQFDHLGPAFGCGHLSSAGPV